MALSLRYADWRSKTGRFGGAQKQVETTTGESCELLQAALDLLSARIAILDGEGTILAVNQAWRHYVEGGESGYGIGGKYLDFLKSSGHRELAMTVQRVAEVLRGQKDSLQFAYPGSSPGEQRWFQISAARFVDKGTVRLLICHEDVTEFRRAAETQREIEERLVASREEERRRIARELHDGTVQRIFAVNLNLMSLRRLLDISDRKIHELLEETVALSRECMQELRTISYLLRPPLDGHDFLPALSSYVDGFCKRSGIRVNLVLPMRSGRLPSKIENTLFRVAQEALSNIHRHSQSVTATVTLTRGESNVVLEVKDRGKGMPQSAQGSACWQAGGGLAGIQERLQELGGSLEFRPAHPGTIVAATVPLHPTDALPSAVA